MSGVATIVLPESPAARLAQVLHLLAILAIRRGGMVTLALLLLWLQQAVLLFVLTRLGGVA